jgi:hypothetical protein
VESEIEVESGKWISSSITGVVLDFSCARSSILKYYFSNSVVTNQANLTGDGVYVAEVERYPRFHAERGITPPFSTHVSRRPFGSRGSSSRRVRIIIASTTA